MRNTTRNAFIILAGALSIAVFVFRGALPELVRYMRIRRM
jgi:hypothetical protein